MYKKHWARGLACFFLGYFFFWESLWVKKRNLERGTEVKLSVFAPFPVHASAFKWILGASRLLPSPCFTGWLLKVQTVLSLLVFCFFFFNFSLSLLWGSFKSIYTYHSLKFDDSALWLLVWCTAEAAGDIELLLWFSVDGDTMVGGVEDSYPELAAGDGCDPGLVDSWTFE